MSGEIKIKQKVFRKNLKNTKIVSLTLINFFCTYKSKFDIYKMHSMLQDFNM